MDFKQYIGKDILAWLSYNVNYEGSNDRINTVCYVFPRVLIKGNNHQKIEPVDFPTRGGIEVRI